nr:hypothetical protein [Mesorhizobium sp.]
MGNEQQRHIVPCAQVYQDLKDLGAYRHIEHRHRFVGDDEFRFHGKRSGNYDALALPA